MDFICEDFDIEAILECGQCFRFARLGDKDYELFAFGKRLRVWQAGNSITLSPCGECDYIDIWRNYFDLDVDYGRIKAALVSKGGAAAEAAAAAPGLRILRQEPWECLASFIVSQNNNIPRIKSVIEKMVVQYGEGDAFPEPARLAGASEEDLMRRCGTGFRAKYLIAAAKKTEEGFLEKIKGMTTPEARTELMTLYGVGPKVADCALLFSFNRRDMFPVDVWIKRAMQAFYFDGRDVPLKDIHAFAENEFGELAGYAQQYLFYYAREGARSAPAGLMEN